MKLENTIRTNSEKEEQEEINEEFSISVVVDSNKINSYIKDDLFIPKSANLYSLEIDYTGNIESIDNATFDKATKKITGEFKNESEFIITLKDDQTKKVIIMQSDLPSIYINNITTKEDTNGNKVSKALQEVNSGSKEIKYDASAFVTDGINKKSDISQTIEFKGRGNYTWKLPKRGYQIKFSKKQSVLGMSKAKTWILLANYMDNSYARNKVAFDFAKELGLNYTPNYKFVDLWIDGNYLGIYMITEKVQVNENRVNLNNPNGIIAELDNSYYTYEENWFKSDISQTAFTLKDSVADDEDEENSISKQAFEQFRKDINDFEKALYADNKDWDKISSMIDVESFIKYYFVQELSEDPDSCRTSVFMHRDGNSDIIHIGPVWDYDSAFGNYTEQNLGGNPNVDYVINIQKYMEASNDWYNQLFKIKEFREEASRIYNSEVKQILSNIKDQTNPDIEKTVNMNNIVWDTLGKKSSFGRVNKATYEEECEYLNNWIQQRISYLNKRYSEDSDMYKVKYQTHIQDFGWEKQIAEDGEMSGTEGQSKRLEAIKIKLNNSSKYSIRYRVHVQDIGWTDWVYDGELAGTEGRSLRLEAIEIEIVPKRHDSDSSTKNENALISYKAHIQNVGDTEYGSDGEIVGTIGKELRLEGLKIELGESLPDDISLEINEHIQDIGWVYGLTDKQFIGTQGKSLRIEALSFKLKGESAENYTIKYRVHIQNIGWQDWKQDGDIAGTTVQSLRIEAIQIQIIEK